MPCDQSITDNEGVLMSSALLWQAGRLVTFTSLNKPLLRLRGLVIGSRRARSVCIWKALPNFSLPLRLPSGVYQALLSASQQTNVPSLNSSFSLPSHVEELPWLRTGSRSHRGHQHRPRTTMHHHRTILLGLDLKTSCPLHGSASIRMPSLPCRRPSHPNSMRLWVPATRSPSVQRPPCCTRLRARHFRTRLRAS
jgi:hypothetical protein